MMTRICPLNQPFPFAYTRAPEPSNATRRPRSAAAGPAPGAVPTTARPPRYPRDTAARQSRWAENAGQSKGRGRVHVREPATLADGLSASGRAGRESLGKIRCAGCYGGPVRAAHAPMPVAESVVAKAISRGPWLSPFGVLIRRLRNMRPYPEQGLSEGCRRAITIDIAVQHR